MKYHALFVIFEKAAKCEIVVCCKLKVVLYGLMQPVSIIVQLNQLENRSACCPNFEKVEGAYCFRLAFLSVQQSVTHFFIPQTFNMLIPHENELTHIFSCLSNLLIYELCPLD